MVTFEQIRDSLTQKARELMTMGSGPCFGQSLVDLSIIADTESACWSIKRGRLEVDIWLEDKDEAHAFKVDTSIPYRELRDVIEQAMYELSESLGWTTKDVFYGALP